MLITNIFKEKLLNANHFMIDCESLSVDHKSPVLTIGMAQFKINTIDNYSELLNNKDRTLSLSLDVQSQFDKGFIPSFSTIEWWMTQDSDARSKSFNLKNKISVVDALNSINLFVNKFKSTNSDVFLWANGSLSDTVWIENLYSAFNVPEIFSFREKMCYRTVVNMFEYKSVQVDGLIKHDALSDSIYQIAQLQNIFNN